MSDLNVNWESNSNRETSFNRWSGSAAKVFTSSRDGVQDVFCPSKTPTLHHQIEVHGYLGSMSVVFTGCQHRQVCILRLPLLPQLEMGCFLCYIVAVWYITAPSWKPPIWIFQLVGIILHQTASLQGKKNTLVKRCKMAFECEESKKEALIILLWWLLSFDMNCRHWSWASWLQSG